MNKLTEYSVYRYFPPKIAGCLMRIPSDISANMTDLIVGVGRPITVYTPERMYYIGERGVTDNSKLAVTLFSDDASYLLLKLCEGSVYAHEQSIREGYITTPEGCRVGIAGRAVVSDGVVCSVRDISEFCFRLPSEIIGCSLSVRDSLYRNGIPVSSLLISPPGHGKTTLLRDIAREYAESGFRVCVIDERREIAGDRKNKSTGECAVLSGYPKEEGINIALRSFSPEVIVFDEIGSVGDIQTVRRGRYSGVAFVTSAHGKDTYELVKREGYGEIISVFDNFIKIEKKYNGFFYNINTTLKPFGTDMQNTHLSAGKARSL